MKSVPKELKNLNSQLRGLKEALDELMLANGNCELDGECGRRGDISMELREAYREQAKRNGWIDLFIDSFTEEDAVFFEYL